MALPIGLQLFTVRDLMNNDFAGTLKAIADLGYAGVELAGLGGNSPSDVRKMVDDFGMKICGMHDGSVFDDAGPAIEIAQALGIDHITQPFLADEYRNVEGYKKVAEMLNVSGAKVAAAGMQLCYHNHAFEFDKLEDGSTGFQIFINDCDAKLVKFEVDLGWVKVGGDDPLEFCRALNGRVPLLHVKDMAELDPVVMAEVGTGQVDFPPIIAEAAQWGSQWLIIEQDRDWIDGDPLKSITTSLANLKQIIG